MGNKLSNTLKRGESFFERVFHCPGCGNGHGFRSKEWPMPEGLSKDEKKFFSNKWTWNGNMESPTLSPSVHVKKEIGKDKNGKAIYKTICHSFVTDGKIKFLNDCTHKLAGQTVEIPDF